MSNRARNSRASEFRKLKKEVMKPVVILEPALHLQSCLLTVPELRELANLYHRWAHQLLVSAAIQEAHACAGAPPRPARQVLRLPLRRSPLRSDRSGRAGAAPGSR